MTTDNKPIEIYQTADGQTRIEVRLEAETVWLTQRQMGEVFDTTPENVLMHLRNIYNDDELAESATAKDFLAVHQEGNRQVKRRLKHYNLDAIISVGYRVNSSQATRFRQWSTRVLREYLTQGYVLDKTRFEKNAAELEQALALIQKAASSPVLDDTGRGLVDIISRYTQTFLWLQRYDEGLLEEPCGQTGGELPTPEVAMAALNRLKQQPVGWISAAHPPMPVRRAISSHAVDARCLSTLRPGVISMLNGLY